MHIALSLIMLLQECCNAQWENVPGGVLIRIKHLLHSSAVRYGKIFSFAISHADSCNKYMEVFPSGGHQLEKIPLRSHV